MSDKLKINEIFYSIDGEGMRAGMPAIFIRTSGCNLRCNYCDTEYAFCSGELLSVSEILAKIKEFPCDNVTLTGGEPLLQSSINKLLYELAWNSYNVIIETNGSCNISKAQEYASICMDWKAPSSGMTDKMVEKNLYNLRLCDVLKIVVRNEDLPEVKKFLNSHTILPTVYISPVFGEANLEEIAEFVKSYRGENILKMQLQMHKIIWDPQKRGV